MRSVNQKYGGIVFWDSQGYEYLFQLEERHSAEFNKWKHEWIKHLSKLKIRVWIDTISLSYFIDQKHTLYPYISSTEFEWITFGFLNY
jgi:hypothetical protein